MELLITLATYFILPGDLKIYMYIFNIQSTLLELRTFDHLKCSASNDSFSKGVVNLLTTSLEVSSSHILSLLPTYLHLDTCQRHSC